MAKKETTTDLWVHDLLVNVGIYADARGSINIEIEDALKTASKKGTGKIGRPEYIAVVKDYVIVIEGKKDLSYHLKYDDICL